MGGTANSPIFKTVPLLNDLKRIFGMAQPQAMDRYTRRPIYFEDTLPGAYGIYNPLLKDIRIARNAPDVNKTIKHEVLHSIFDTTSPGRSLTSMNPVGTMVSNAKSASKAYKDISDDDFEHLLIKFLQEDNTRDATLDGLLGQISKNEQEIQAKESLKKIFRRK